MSLNVSAVVADSGLMWI